MTKVLKRFIFCVGFAGMLAALGGHAQTPTNATPDFKEIYDLIHEHLEGESDTDLNRDAVFGLLNQLHGKVSLVAVKTDSVTTNLPLFARSNLFEGSIGYLCIGRVGDGLSAKVSEAFKGLSGSNGLKGMIVDLRFAGGDDYAAAVATANLFISKERPLLDWGKGPALSKDNPNAITLPLSVLVNQKTAAGAEALAEMLRQYDGAILLGSMTAGEATMSKDFPLKNGDVLRIATAAIKLGNGQALSAKGVTPDIMVSVKPDIERIFYADPYKDAGSGYNGLASLFGETNSPSSTNRPVRAHQLTEAELIRDRKAHPGLDVEDLPTVLPGNNEVEKPVIHDPALGRALDLVKGIAAMHR